jgi:hypothetical protein
MTVPLLAAGSLGAALLTACTASSSAASESDAAATPTTSTAATDPPASGQTLVADPVLVYPTAGSRLASPQTQISLRDVAPSDIGTVSVAGSQSGPHPGVLRADSDGHGASFYPAQPFTPGETVTVHTSLDVAGGQSGSYSFTISRPTAFSAQPRTEPDDPSQVQSFRSEPALQPPKYTITHGSLTPGAGDVFVGPRSGPGQDGPMIVDAAGQLVWFKSLTGGITPSDFRVQSYQGQPVLTWWQGDVTPTGQGIGEDVIYNDSYQQIATVKAGNGYHADLHDFTLTPQDTALITAYQPVRWDLSGVGGPKNGIALDSIMQEIDIATGNVLLEWHALDHVPVADTYADVSQVGKKGQPDYFDYFHINSLDRSASGDLLISGRATHTVYEVDPATGDILWRLGGKHSTFTGDGTDFSSQHDSKWESADTISLFDNAAGVGKPTSKKSSAMIVRLDPATHTATLVQRFISPDVPQAPSQGDTQLLPGGDVFVGWGQQQQVSQFAPDGSLVFEATLPAKDNSYRAFRFPWSGHPLTKPSAFAAGSTVYASWNGATAVASWRVLTGASAGHLRAVATAPWHGFETAITASKLGAVVEVQALDQAGTVLGTSARVHPGR